MHTQNKKFLKTQAVRRGFALRKFLQFLGLPILQPQPIKIFEKQAEKYNCRKYMEL